MGHIYMDFADITNLKEKIEFSFEGSLNIVFCYQYKIVYYRLFRIMLLNIQNCTKLTMHVI